MKKYQKLHIKKRHKEEFTALRKAANDFFDQSLDYFEKLYKKAFDNADLTIGVENEKR